MKYDELMWQDIHTKFHKIWFRHSKVDKGDTQTHRQEGYRISLLEVCRLKIEVGL
jgi:hypothetical protein